MTEAEDRLAELESVWYDVIASVTAGRTNGLVCPECNHPDGLAIEETGGKVIVRCPGCNRVVEVQVNTA